jgi:hypothetical protein
MARPWSPIGVTTRGGDVYILETGDEPRSTTKGPRIRRIDADGALTTVATVPDDG